MMYKIISFLFFTFLSFTCFSQDLSATVKTPPSVIAGSDITVEITVNKSGAAGFMKYFQELPGGYSASVIESKGGDFTFADNGAKILWMDMPAATQFSISYRIMTPQNAEGTISVGGRFSYIVNNERKVFDLTPEKVIIVNQKKESDGPKDQPPSDAPKIVPPPDKEKKNDEIKKETSPVIISTPARVPATATTVTTGKTYRVQIGAFTSKPLLDNVPEPSKVVLENGVTKYFSGNFKTYEEAAKRKKEMIEKGFQGAFVVSFENGKISK